MKLNNIFIASLFFLVFVMFASLPFQMDSIQNIQNRGHVQHVTGTLSNTDTVTIAFTQETGFYTDRDLLRNLHLFSQSFQRNY